ncbi:PadR family transcriptional regulator [Actinomycetospora sp. NBRC 106375]|uniref:PadR family transcriptional regulator n=1 Tax=Actinomycetospora sp. NBRC 106375 TaxID=3032207 RepID=UPI0024A2B9EF|nr:PadR family transcriptional regulator [Actinomycetospora sp. NBRC 106375]GLZ45372.1 PadR family transcriptional regulator [Actinomycetospora sp. NBRC 106375]
MTSLRREDRDLPGLTVLALLLTGPRHTYEMQRLMVVTHKDFVTGLPRSMYHAVGKLEKAALIEVAGVEREEGRPERTVYALTGAGREALRDRVRRLLAVPDPDATLLTAALSFVGVLPVADAAAALRARSEELSRRADGNRAAAGEVPHLPRVLLVETEFETARLDAERAFVDGLVADLDAGVLTWPADMRELVLPEGVPPVT